MHDWKTLFPGDRGASNANNVSLAGWRCDQRPELATGRLSQTADQDDLAVPPGGSVDITARLIADPARRAAERAHRGREPQRRLGQIGMEAAARSAPDGYTIVLNTIPLVTNQSLFPKALLGSDQGLRADRHGGHRAARAGAPKRLDVNNVQDLLKPRGQSGQALLCFGGVRHHVPFLRGALQGHHQDVSSCTCPIAAAAPALVDTLSGQVDMSFPTLSAAAPHVKSGQLKALAITGATRSEHPAGRADDEGGRRQGFRLRPVARAPRTAATPREIVTKLNTSLNAALNSPETRRKFEEQGFEPFPTSPEETTNSSLRRDQALRDPHQVEGHQSR